MYGTAISFAATIHCHLKPGISTRGLGNCFIEACIDQFLWNDFEDLTDSEKEPTYWTHKLADILEGNIPAYNMYNTVKGAGNKNQQWKHDWETFRNSGEFHSQAGDLILPRLAMILHKNILVFNTFSDANNPITFI